MGWWRSIYAFWGILLLAAPLTSLAPHQQASSEPAGPRLSSAPKSGLLKLEGGARLYVPASASARWRRPPLLVLLHGTGGSGSAMLNALRSRADRDGIVMLALTATEENWDAVEVFSDAYEAGSGAGRTRWPVPVFGRDARRIHAALEAVSQRVTIDPCRVGVMGFSHGASYALSLGASDPQRFRTIIAVSPGILVLPPQPSDGQLIYIAHGTRDGIFPFRRTRQSFLPRLAQLGFSVTFRPFQGGHALPDLILDEALQIFLNPTPHPQRRETRGPVGCTAS